MTIRKLATLCGYPGCALPIEKGDAMSFRHQVNPGGKPGYHPHSARPASRSAARDLSGSGKPPREDAGLPTETPDSRSPRLLKSASPSRLGASTATG